MPGPTETDLATRVTRSKAEMAAEAIENFALAVAALEQSKGPNAICSLSYLLNLESMKAEARADLVKALAAFAARPVLRVV